MTPPAVLALRYASPILCTRAGARECALAAHAVTTLAGAVHARREGPDAERRVPRWAHVLAGTELVAPDPAQAMAARGMAPGAARIVATRLATIAPDARRALATRRWVGMANAFGVPATMHPELRILAALACEAAVARAAAGAMDIATFLHCPSRWTADPARRLALIGAPLGHDALNDDEVLELLDAAGAALVRATPGIQGWLAPRPRPVYVRAPSEHPGVPLALLPLVLTRPDALARLLEGSLVTAALGEASRGRFDVTRIPQP